MTSPVPPSGGPLSSQVMPSTFSDAFLTSQGGASLPGFTGSVRGIGSNNPNSAMSEMEGQGQAEDQASRQFKKPPVLTSVKVSDELGSNVEREFLRFLQDFTASEVPAGGTDEPLYRQKLAEMVKNDLSTLTVSYAHLKDFNEQLAKLVSEQYVRMEPFLRKALQGFVAENFPEKAYTRHETELRNFHVAFTDVDAQYRMRELLPSHVGVLLGITATVTRTSVVRPELVTGTFQCNQCKEIYGNIEQQFVYSTPKVCTNPLCNNSDDWKLLVEKSQFVDWQKVRVQENSTDIPPGSVPRNMDVIVRHDMCERAKPGDKCVFTGSLIAIPDTAQLLMSGRHLNVTRQLKDSARTNKETGGQGVQGLKDMGSRELTYRYVFIASTVQASQDKFGDFYSDAMLDNPERAAAVVAMLSSEDRKEILKMIDSKNIYQELISSVAPSVFGHRRIKEGLLLQLLGGVHKVTPEGTNSLRGDINVCIVGDPGMSKSQFLKWAASFLPRSVYTSGKASSAAGLTASVVKDSETHDFTIEAGALMLADNGICCIDEFDKMDIKDQVAIHEAMEQQTISIAKAGIHATLNARTSILAAANPVAGRYDVRKSLKHNVNLSPPIMSRFDLFFVVLDELKQDQDRMLALHILRIHRDMDLAIQPKYSIEALRRYVMFAKSIRPKITEAARVELINAYQLLRQRDFQEAGRSGYHVTVRQLESLIRLSEAIARGHASGDITAEHVLKAVSLLSTSIVKTHQDDVDLDEDEEVNAIDTVDPNADPLKVASAVGEGDLMDETVEEAAATGGDGEKKEKLSIAYDEYMRLVKSILAMMIDRQRRVEQKAAAAVTTMRAPAPIAAEDEMDESVEERSAIEATEPEEVLGMTVLEISEWYLNQIENSIDSEEQYLEEMKKIRRVLKHMVKKDNYLVPLASTMTDESADAAVLETKISGDTVLMVHPDVDVGF